MAKDIGEDLVGAWLRLVTECDFVQYNIPLRVKQGEIDVIGINLAQKVAYICEVATHLGGLQYTKGNQPDNVNKITHKFQDNVSYARRYLNDFEHHFMLWSPIVVHPRTDDTKHNQFQDLRAIRRNLLEPPYHAEIKMVVNEVYLEKVNELRDKAAAETAASEYPVFRLLQILHRLEQHVERLNSRGISTTMLIEKES
jgi:Holliday junction resolvase-like predicted endonuclease